MTPGETNLSRGELTRAESALTECRALIDIGKVEGAANRVYYAVFHAARAALLTKGLHSRTHKGQIETFFRAFGPTPILSQLLELRGKADYGDEPLAATIDELQRALRDGEAFVGRCQQIVETAQEGGPDASDPPPDV